MKTTISALFLMLVLASASDFSMAIPVRKGSTQGWKAGVARVVITPGQSQWMAGYSFRTEPSQGKLHDLWAKALFLEDADGRKAVLITTDLLGMTKEITNRICNQLKQKHGLSPAQIMINSSHTHSGPVLQNALTDIYPSDSMNVKRIVKYTKWLEEKIVNLVSEACRSMEPVRIYSDNGIARFQVNRRINKISTPLELTELRGPNDFAVPVIKVENLSGKVKAIAFGYACHATVLSINLWSGDYPGFAQIELEKRYPGSTALFFQGAGADQNPLPRRTVALAQQYGRDLASAVECTVNDGMRELAPQLKTSYAEVDLPFVTPPTTQELTKAIETEYDYYRLYVRRWANRMLQKTKDGEPLPKSYSYPLQVWQLGNQNIIGLGGEVVIEYAINLKKILGSESFVFGYNNDVSGYIASSSILNEGGYEADSSHIVYGLPARWDPKIENLILDNVVRLAVEAGITPIKNPASGKKEMLIAKPYFSGFDRAHDTYNAISSASDGNIYYVLSSTTKEKAGQMYVYNPDSDKTKWVADLTEVCGEKDAKAISQGKSHVSFYEMNGKLFFATHVGYYEMIDGAECLPVTPPEGYKLYPGGHIVSYSLSDGKFKDLAIAPNGEGIITMTMDAERGQIYGITWPTGYFLHYDTQTDKLKNMGLISAKGEAGTPGKDYRVLCRSMFVDQRDGSVYYSTAEGDIYTYNPTGSGIKKVEGANLRLDYFGKYDPTRPGNMGYNWRKIIWYPREGVAYGVHGNSGYLFRFDPRRSTIEIVDRITSEPSRKSGMFDQFSYGYLGLELGPDEQTLYYLTGGPIYIDGKRLKGVDEINMGAAKGLENLHLITYHIPSGKYTDHGPVFYEDGSRPTYVNSIAVDSRGTVYTLARFIYNGNEIEDLVKIPNPFNTKNN